MITATMTNHAIRDRAERLAFIAEYVGVGNIQYRFPSDHDGGCAEYCVTSTGVLIIMSTETKAIITAYCPTKEKMIMLFHSNGWSRVPNGLMEKVVKNRKIAKKMGFV